jgi:hypothetical protein
LDFEAGFCKPDGSHSSFKLRAPNWEVDVVTAESPDPPEPPHADRTRAAPTIAANRIAFGHDDLLSGFISPSFSAVARIDASLKKKPDVVSWS